MKNHEVPTRYIIEVMDEGKLLPIKTLRKKDDTTITEETINNVRHITLLSGIIHQSL
jgi:hypothetical protein